MQYRPLDLREQANLAAAAFQDPETLELGEVTRFGIPFLIGKLDDAEHTFASVGPSCRSLNIPVNESAEWIIFAHALTETRLFDGDSIGSEAAVYTLYYDDGVAEEFPVRERFEIAASPRDRYDRPIPLDWGQNPFLATPDLEHVVPHRTHGRFDQAGGRVKEVVDPSTKLPYTLPYRWYIWVVKNPHPQSTIRSIGITASGEHTVAVGGVTLSHLEEDPLGRTTNRDVLITLPCSATKADIEQLEVTIDRGTASFPYWTVLDEDSIDQPASVPGWGQRWQSHEPRTAHVRLTGSPSATISVRYQNEDVATCGWQELLQAGSVHADNVRFEIVDEDRAWIQTQVIDEDTGKEIPCRIHFRSTSGVPYPPHGHPPHINGELATFAFDLGGDVRLGNKTYAYINGTCEGWLPIGEVVVEISRGFEYEPVQMTVPIAAGQQTLRLGLSRVSNINLHGYYSGDTHGHFVSARGAEFEGAGEGLDVVNLLRTQGGELFTVTEEVREEPLGGGDTPIVFVGQENRTGMFGHINLLGVSEPVMPISTGGPDESEIGTGLETTLSHWADETRAQGGVAILAHFPVPNGEAATLIATERVDALEMIAYDEYNVNEYYKYLNDGYQVPLVGGSDKMTADVPLGIIRTYAGGIDEQELEYSRWLDAIKTGDTFVSSGPLLMFQVNGEVPGQTLTGADTSRLELSLQLHSIFPMECIEIVGVGGVLHRFELDGKTGEHILQTTLNVHRDTTWIAARGFARGVTEGKHHDVYERMVAVHTSPVYVTANPAYVLRDVETQRYMEMLISGSIAHIEQNARRFWPGAVSHRHGEADHLQYLLRPFQEAREVVQGRLRA